MSKRKKKRMRCPHCSGKRVHLLNKKQGIWECLKEDCKHKFLYIPQTSTYLALKPEDIQIVEQTAEPQQQTESKSQQEPNEIDESKPVEVADDPLMKMAEDLGF